MDLISAAILLAISMDPLGNIPVFHALLGVIRAGRVYSSSGASW